MSEGGICTCFLPVCIVCCFILYKHRGSALTIVLYKTVLNILDKKYPFCNHKKSLRVWLSYLTVTNPWNVSLFLGCADVKPWVKIMFPDLSGNIMQQYNNNNDTKKKHLCQELFTLSEHDNYCMMHEHYTLSLKEHHQHHHGGVSHLISLCFLSISQSEKWKIIFFFVNE